jgi:cytochrome b561
MKYDRTTRWIHAGIALTVVIQLVCSLFMEVTRVGRILTDPGYTLFEIHRWSGISVVVLVLFHWFWGLAGNVTSGWSHLFPWFSSTQMKKLLSDLKALPNWIRADFPDQRTQTLPLAGAVHGLGLLTVSGMALSGAIIFFGMAPDGTMPHFVAVVMEIHAVIASFMWGYIIGHTGMAIYHQWRDRHLITDMFNLVKK